LLGRRGRPPIKARDVRELIVTPRRKHSQKPDEQYERIERLVDGPYIELGAEMTAPITLIVNHTPAPNAGMTGRRQVYTPNGTRAYENLVNLRPCTASSATSQIEVRPQCLID
jgi:hypothetical protein